MSTQNSIILPEKQAKARMDRQLKGLKKKKNRSENLNGGNQVEQDFHFLMKL